MRIDSLAGLSEKIATFNADADRYGVGRQLIPLNLYQSSFKLGG